MPRQNQPFVTFQPLQEEKDILDAYCKHYQCSKTEVLRGFLRTLQDFRSQVTEQAIATSEVSDNA